MYVEYKLPNQNKKSRSVIVRSELASTGSPGTSYQLSGSTFIPASKFIKLQFLFLLLIIIIYIKIVFLFLVMVVGHPFVLIQDRCQRNFYNFIAKIWVSMTIGPFFSLKI
ncbi:putative 1-acylglycerol-3-phosphate O-acyltransferase [Helianthus annuus]|nr:putative 1-acylglycerol-3-phosphate O-acyltransferase [Helianthus annuus]KAJ0897884.1 putative 1-acylglycerol-3-phosphate O-acyltransferase [Helianthus annuus]KAJ0901641.1 putative 1-acylglycerol-3-phosphate O-acyltransferase [Helianthus annuus]